MVSPVIPANESERLSALQALHVLDTPPEERFDRITRLAARLFKVPIVLLSLVDADRVWFKSSYGFDLPELKRDSAFCGQAILQTEALVIPDARQDPRFANLPLLRQADGLCFYAGQPLRNPTGLPVGVLCLLADQPRQLSALELETLADLAAWAERELALVKLAALSQQLQEANQQLTRLNQVRSEFVRTVIHKFRSTLAGLQGFSELLRDQHFSLAEVHEIANEIYHGVQRMEQMITELTAADQAILHPGHK